MSDHRPITALELDVTPGGECADGRPIFEWIDPSTLLVDERYQRDLGPKSIALIKRIVGAWDWRRFKPPVATMTDAGLEVIDGQHTAIAAATHPGIDQIPVMIVVAPLLTDRAASFIGHNRDRVAVTAVQLHAAAVAAGDDEAVTVEQVCDRAGVRVLRAVGGYDFKPGETVAIAAVSLLVARRGALRARQILEVLAKAGLAPITANSIKAAELLLTDPEYADQIEQDDLRSAIVALGDVADGEAKTFAATHRVPFWRGLAAVWFRKCRKRRKAA